MTGNINLSSEQIINLKGKLTEWGLLDPHFSSTGDPRERIPHSDKWGVHTVAAAEVMLGLFDRKEADGIISVEEYDFLMGRGVPYRTRATERKMQKILDIYGKHEWYFSRGTNTYNVLFIEDFTRDWKPQKGRLDAWDDVAIVWQCEHSGNARIIEEFYQVTVEPGRHYTDSPVNIDGAARIKIPGQYKAWQRGLHGSGSTAHEGFRQEAPIRITRDKNKDGLRTGDKEMDGVFYCNWHTTSNAPSTIQRWSAGCSVFRYPSEFRKFRGILEGDSRYQISPAYFFIGAYVAGDEAAL
jgi:hypothetical protein